MFGFANQNNAGGTLFGAANNQPNMPANQGGTIFGGQPNAGGVFGNQNVPQNQGGLMGGNVFGGNNAQQGNQGVGVFGASNQNNQNAVFGGNQNNQAGGGVFGSATGGNVFGGQQNQGNQGTIFGGNAGSAGGGVFGNVQSQTQGGAIFGNANNSFKQNAGNNTGAVFGSSGFNNNNANMGGGGVFGNNTFGGQNNQNAGTVFGNATSNTFNKGAVFGGNTSAFSNNSFAANNNNNATTVFGNTNNAQGGQIFGNTQNTPNTPFGANTNLGGAVFGGNQQPQQPSNNIFGGANNNNNNAVFGGNPNQGSNIFSNAQAAQAANTGIFGGNNGQNTSIFGKSNTGPFGGPINTPQNNNSFSFGNNNSFSNQANTGFGQSNLGNTAWGVPTTNQPIAKFTPLKPKNTKIDGKHVVKCIVLLDENLNFCKNQLRIRYIMNGGNTTTPPVIGFANTQPTQPASFNNTAGFSAPNTFQSNPQTAAGNSLFGGNNNAGGSLFGGQPAAQPANGALFGQTQTQPAAGPTGGLFGNNNPNTGGGGLFGAGMANSGNTGFKPAGGSGLFGNTTTSTPAFGGNTPSFGSNPQPSQGLFGANTANTGGGLFGNQATTQPTASTPMFGGSPGFNAQPQNGGLFGQSQPAAGGLFGNSQAQPQTGGLFGQSQPQTGGLFGGASQPAQGGLFGQAQPTSGNFFAAGTQPASGGLFGAQNTPTTGGLFGAQTQSFGNNLVNGFMAQSQPQTQPQPQPQPSMFGSFATPTASNPNSEVATLILNGLFNTDFFKQMMNGSASTPYQEMVNAVKKKNLNISFDDKYEGLSSFKNDQADKPNKYSRSMYNSSINFHHSPYLYTDNSLLDNNTYTYNEFQNMNDKLRRFNDKFQPKPAPLKMQKQIDNNINTNNILPKNFTSKITQKFAFSKTTKNAAHEDELPIVEGGYKITPSLRQLKQKTAEQLKRVPNVVIENQFGKIRFRQPVSLYKKKITGCVEIVQDSIQIIDEEWDQKKCELFFFNFGHYTELKGQPQKNKLERKMRKWMQKNNMYEVNFDKSKGELHVQIYSQ